MNFWSSVHTADENYSLITLLQVAFISFHTPGMAIRMCEKRNHPSMLFMKGFESIEIHIEHRIGIQQ